MIHRARRTTTEIPPKSPTKTIIDWTLAKCFGVGSELFFDQSKINEQNARGLCVKCPIRIECITYGMTQQFGMWGGMTDRERQRLHAQKIRGTCHCGREEFIIVHTKFYACICHYCGVGIVKL